jgi:hypothetical protein
MHLLAVGLITFPFEKNDNPITSLLLNCDASLW